MGHDKPIIKAHAVLKRSQFIADTACKKQETGFWTHLLFYININWFVIILLAGWQMQAFAR